MRIDVHKAALAATFAGAMALAGSGPTQAAPAALNASAVKQAAPAIATEVQYRRRHWRHRHFGPGAAFAGAAAGIIGFAAAQALAPRYYYDYDPYYYGGYYGPYAYYGAPYAYYGAPYAYYGPTYYYAGPRYYSVRRFHRGPRHYHRRAYWRRW